MSRRGGRGGYRGNELQDLVQHGDGPPPIFPHFDIPIADMVTADETKNLLALREYKSKMQSSAFYTVNATVASNGYHGAFPAQNMNDIMVELERYSDIFKTDRGHKQPSLAESLMGSAFVYCSTDIEQLNGFCLLN